MKSPTISSRPGSGAERPATVTPNRTSSLRALRPSSNAHAAWTSVLRVTRCSWTKRCRRADGSVIVVTPCPVSDDGCSSGSGVAASNPASARRQNDSDAAGSRASSQST
jgi:hypothetical protein